MDFPEFDLSTLDLLIENIDKGIEEQKKYSHPPGWSTDHLKAQDFKGDSCESCGETNKLHAHHVDGNPGNNEPDNIQTLCVYCHNFLHRTAKRLGWEQPGKMPTFSC